MQSSQGQQGEGRDVAAPKRLAVLERTVAQLTEMSAQTARSVEKLEGAVERLSGVVTSVGKPQWQTWVAASALLLAFVATVGSPYADQQRENSLLIRDNEHRTDSTESRLSVTTATLKALADIVERSEERLHQIEMDGAHHHALRERMDQTLQRIEKILYEPSQAPKD